MIRRISHQDVIIHFILIEIASIIDSKNKDMERDL